MNEMTEDAGSDLDKESLIEKTKQAANFLVQILHSQGCRGSPSCNYYGSAGQTSASRCNQIYMLSRHSSHCQYGANCPIAGCLTTKKLTDHYFNCLSKQTNTCLVCALVASKVKKNNQIFSNNLQGQLDQSSFSSSQSFSSPTNPSMVDSGSQRSNASRPRSYSDFPSMQAADRRESLNAFTHTTPTHRHSLHEHSQTTINFASQNKAISSPVSITKSRCMSEEDASQFGGHFASNNGSPSSTGMNTSAPSRGDGHTGVFQLPTILPSRSRANSAINAPPAIRSNSMDTEEYVNYNI